MWQQRYMNIAKEISTWSKDPSTKVGAVIIGDKGQIVSQGYNGFPRNILDSPSRYNDRMTKYELIVHAEANAIYNAIHNNTPVLNCSIYIYGMGICVECAKVIIQCGLSKVYFYNSNNERWAESTSKAVKIMKEAGVQVNEIFN